MAETRCASGGQLFGSGDWLGVWLVLLSACGFGSMALFAKLAYGDGVDTASLLAYRFVIAALVLAAWGLWRGWPWPRGRAAMAYGLMGAVYAAMAWAYFSALHYAASATVALVLYSYPALVAFGGAVLGLDRFGRPEALTIALASAGLALMLGGGLSGSPWGLVLAFGAALCYAGYILLGGGIRSDAHPVCVSALVLSVAAAIFSCLAIGQGLRLPHTLAGWGAVTALALLGTAVAIAAFIAGLIRIGPTLASVVSTLEPVVTVLLGVLFLGESLGLRGLLGGLLILAASLSLVWLRGQAAAGKACDG
jgi:drug/metabolite transporter (DMT)-like permease